MREHEETLRLQAQVSRQRSALTKSVTLLNKALASVDETAARLNRLERSRWVRLGRLLRVCP